MVLLLSSGTRNSILNTEARTMEADVLSRRCVLMRLADFSFDKYQKALRQSAGAVVIMLPKNMSAMPQDVLQVKMQRSVGLQNVFSLCFSEKWLSLGSTGKYARFSPK